ncbi:hypothetical protein [Streptomyces sp. NPDC006510]
MENFSWGHGYESEIPLDTPVKELAKAVLAMLQVQRKSSVLLS